MTQSNILYPYAIVPQDRHVIYIGDVDRGSGGYECIGCGGYMMARIGSGVRVPHFAHIGDDAGCNPESAIHKFAKHLFAVYPIARGYTVIEGPCAYRDLDALWRPECVALYYIFRFHTIGDSLGDTLEIEKSVHGPAGKITPDVLLSNTRQRHVGIEIVVSNPVSIEKRKAYLAAGVQGVIYNLKSWDDVKDLYRALVNGVVRVHDTINVAQICTDHARREGLTVGMDGTYRSIESLEHECDQGGCAEIVHGPLSFCAKHVGALERESAASQQAFYKFMKGEHAHPPNPDYSNPNIVTSRFGRYAQQAKDRFELRSKPLPPPPGVIPPNFQ